MKLATEKQRLTAVKLSIVQAITGAIESFSNPETLEAAGDNPRPVRLEIPIPGQGSIVFQLSSEQAALEQVLKAAKKLPSAPMAAVRCPSHSRPSHSLEEQRDLALRIYGDDAASAVDRLTWQQTHAEELGLDDATVSNLIEVIESLRAFRPASFPPPLRPGAEFAKMEETELLALVSKTAADTSSTHIETGKALFVIDDKRPVDSGSLSKYVRAKTGAEIPDHAFCCAVAFRLVARAYLPERHFDAAPLRWLLQASAILNESERKAPKANEHFAEVASILQYRPADGFDQLRTIKRGLRPTKTASDSPGATSIDVLSAETFKSIGLAVADCSDADKLNQTADFLEAILKVTRARLEVVEPAAAIAA